METELQMNWGERHFTKPSVGCGLSVIAAIFDRIASCSFGISCIVSDFATFFVHVVVWAFAILLMQQLFIAYRSNRMSAHLVSKSRDLVGAISNELLNAIKTHSGFDKLASFANSLPSNFRHEYADITASLHEIGGGLVIHCMQKEYLDYLERLSGKTTSTLYVTMRGGEKPVYTPKWFFEDSTLLSDDKLRWLNYVRDSRIPTKIRLLMYSDDELADFFLNSPEERCRFFEAMMHGKQVGETEVWLVSPRKILDLMKQRHGDEECQIVYDDFAIFDGCVVLKHNGAASLTVAIQRQIDLYNEVFATFKRLDNCSKKRITLEKIGSQTWAEWENSHRAKTPTPAPA